MVKILTNEQINTLQEEPGCIKLANGKEIYFDFGDYSAPTGKNGTIIVSVWNGKQFANRTIEVKDIVDVW